MRALPRLVATDLDGTIVADDGIVTDRTVATLRAVEALGVPVVFVTGRPARWMAEVAERTGHTGLAICANGAVLYDLHTEQIVEHDPIPIEWGSRWPAGSATRCRAVPSRSRRWPASRTSRRTSRGGMPATS